MTMNYAEGKLVCRKVDYNEESPQSSVPNSKFKIATGGKQLVTCLLVILSTYELFCF